MKEHQQAQAQQQQKAAALGEAHATADIQGKQAKAQADAALAQERKVNAVALVHGMHSDFSAPPYGQPYVAPDNPPGGATELTATGAMHARSRPIRTAEGREMHARRTCAHAQAPPWRDSRRRPANEAAASTHPPAIRHKQAPQHVRATDRPRRQVVRRRAYRQHQQHLEEHRSPSPSTGC